MACNCKTNAKLIELGLRYGTGGKLTRKEILKKDLKGILLSILSLLITIIVLPFIVLYVVFKGLFSKNKGINFKKIFRLKQNVREEQNI